MMAGPNGASGGGGHPRIIGESAAITQARDVARRLAPTGLPILLVGATGTGKELFAEAIHAWSGSRGAFVDVNCGALPRDMAEALLFGHRRGAFTGAHEDSRGLIEAADGGTLFLDELTSLPRDIQPKLLRALEAGEVRRLGETVKRRVQVRVVGAAQPTLPRLMRLGEFREDLYQRLAGAVILLPSLAERLGDIPELVRTLAAPHKREISDDALEVLRLNEWPGNVRQLRMVVERCVHLTDRLVIPASIVREALAVGALPREQTTEERDQLPPRERVLEVLAEHRWNAAQTAHALGVGRTTFFKELKSLGISLRLARSDVAWRARKQMGE